MCPRGLDFPRADAERLHWIEPCVLRDEPALGAQPEAGDPRPLIFASLGSQVHRVPWAEMWFRQVAAVLARRSDWHGILAVGEALAPRLADRAIPGRLSIVAWAPQRLVLDRAAVALIHGGLGSVKECIVAGVPMALFPTGHDQVGNALRVAARGLGLVGSPRGGRRPKIEAMVETLLGDRVRRVRVAAMGAELKRVEAEDAGAAVVESLL
jgi:UDP:flavonoid glycosyltransferase YjiC (YdhE family)